MPDKRFLVLWLVASLAMFYSCKAKPEVKTNIVAMQEIMKADSQFSAMSQSAGMRKAFLEFIADEGVVLRPNNMPITGADAIEFLSQADDSSSILTWEPIAGDVSTAGDMGYTYGTYNLRAADTSFKGTYLNVWKKQPDGKWKFVMDTGNEGIGPGQ